MQQRSQLPTETLHSSPSLSLWLHHFLCFYLTGPVHISHSSHHLLSQFQLQHCSSLCWRRVCLGLWKSHLPQLYCRNYQCRASPSGSKRCPRGRSHFLLAGFSSSIHEKAGYDTTGVLVSSVAGWVRDYFIILETTLNTDMRHSWPHGALILLHLSLVPL